MRVLSGVALAAIVSSGCAQPTPEMRIVNDAVAAMGGRARVESVATWVVRGTGETFNLGQNKSSAAALPSFEVSEFTVEIDFENERYRRTQVVTPRYLTRNTATRTQIYALDGDVAFDVAPSGAANRLSERVVQDRRAALQRSPLGILRAALAEGATLGNVRSADGLEVVDVTTPAGDLFTLSIDGLSKLPASVVSMGYHAYLGDVAFETAFSEYADVDGLKLPTRYVFRIDGNVVAAIDVIGNVVNGDIGDLAAPAEVGEATTTTPPATVTVEEIADGVWYLTGQSHHSIVVEFDDHLTLIEAPQNDVRALAVIARARALADKPLTHLVVTHHHFDHSGGVRAAISEGLTLIVHEASGDFYQTLANRRHAIHQDALAVNPQPVRVETVSDEMALTDGSQSVMLYPITDSPHADTLLMVYFPTERLLVEADVFTPPAPDAATSSAYPFVENLLENVERRGLRVDRLLPIHGRVVPFGDLVEIAESLRETTE